MTPRELARFWSHVVVEPTTGCWLWTAFCDRGGYGRLMVGHGRKGQYNRTAHRLSYEHFVGPLGTLHVLHKCDVPACCNPDHLFLGTQADNNRDMVAKGRCSRRGCPKLTPAQVEEIRALRGRENYRVLAQRYGVKHWAIHDIWAGRTWRTEAA